MVSLMAFLRNTLSDDLTERLRVGRLVSTHVAWELNEETGIVRLARKREKIILIALALLTLNGSVHPAQVLLTVGHWGGLSPLLWLISLTVVLYLGWVFMPRARANDSLGTKFVLAAVILGFGLWFATTVLFRTVPKLATSFFTDPKTVEFTLASVSREGCRGGCSLVSIIHGERRIYAYNIDRQPLPARIKLAKPNGFHVFSSGTRFTHGEPAVVTGQANWFGLRIEHIERRRDDM